MKKVVKKLQMQDLRASTLCVAVPTYHPSLRSSLTALAAEQAEAGGTGVGQEDTSKQGRGRCGCYEGNGEIWSAYIHCTLAVQSGSLERPNATVVRKA